MSQPDNSQKGDESQKLRRRKKSQPQAADTASRPKPADQPAGSDGELNDRLRSHLVRIVEHCDQFPTDDNEFPAELKSKSQQIRKSAQSGLDAIREWLDRSVQLGAEEEQARRHKFAHDTVNRVVIIKFHSERLLKVDDEHFSRFSDVLQEIHREYDAFDVGLRRWATDERSSAPSSASPTTPPAPKAPVYAPSRPRETAVPGNILVVDDNVELCRAMQSWLSEMGHNVATAFGGAAAIEYVQQHPVDLILLDLHMDGLNGAQVLDAIKQDYALRSIPVVMLSSITDLSAVAECIRNGADDFLHRNCDKIILEARVSSCLFRIRMRRNELALHRQIRKAKADADRLLHQVFPYTIAEELRTSGRVQPREYDNVAVMFCDIVGFTSYCAGKKARVVVNDLNELFSSYDDITRRYQIEKIKTIGDCFMVTAGLLRRFTNPVLTCLECAEEMRNVARTVGPGWKVRIGIHAGPVVAGMVGRQKTFDVWGDTVNTAQRVESAAEPSHIAVSDAAWAQVFESCYGKSMGLQELKGKGALEVFRFEGFRADVPRRRKRPRRLS